jgi:hypothetical protein
MADDVPMPYAGSDCGCACDPHGNGWDFGTKEGDEVTLSEFLAGGFAVALVIVAVWAANNDATWRDKYRAIMFERNEMLRRQIRKDLGLPDRDR